MSIAIFIAFICALIVFIIGALMIAEIIANQGD